MVSIPGRVRAVLFDIGNVIIGFDHQTICDRLRTFTGLSARDIYHQIFSSPLMRRYDEGNVASEEFYEVVIKQIQADTRLTFEAFTQIWQATFIENPAIDRLLDRLQPEIPTILLSNTNELHWQYLAKHPVVRKHFADEGLLVLSFQVGCCKPDERIFREALSRCGCAAKEALYVDDIASYVEAFVRFGGKGIIYNCQTDPMGRLERELSSWGLLEQIEENKE